MSMMISSGHWVIAGPENEKTNWHTVFGFLQKTCVELTALSVCSHGEDTELVEISSFPLIKVNLHYF